MRGLVLVVVGISALLATASADPLDKPAFTATPAELLAAAKAAPSVDDSTTLREEIDDRIDGQGRLTNRWRLVFAIRTQKGVSTWDTIEQSYRAWFQDHPAVRARVIDPSGQVTELDPKLETDQPAMTVHGVASDMREIRAPLPKLVIGSVIEEEVTIVDRVPSSRTGRGAVVAVSDRAMQSMRVTLTAPAGAKVRHIERGLGTTRAKHGVANGIETWSYALGPATAQTLETNLPSDVVYVPYVGISTIAGWGALAKDLNQRVEQQLASGAATWPADVPKAATLEAARAIVAWLQHRVTPTYLGVDYMGFAPESPADTLKRGSADDFSLAVALVGLLRAAGITAEVALVDRGPGFDVDIDLPELTDFDQVLVRAHLGTDVWIDPTAAFYRAGDLPPDLRNRRALLLSATTSALVTTPVTGSPNTTREVRTIDLSELGSAQIKEVHTATGINEALERAWFAGKNATEIKDSMTAEGKSKYQVDTLVSYTVGDPLDLATPLATSLAVKGSPRGLTRREQIDVHLTPTSVLNNLPAALTEEDAEPRKYDFVWTRPGSYEVENHLVVPEGFSMPAVADRTIDVGSAKLTVTQRVSGREFIATYRFESGKQRWTPAEVTSTRAALKAARADGDHLVFPQTARKLAAAGKVHEAIAEANRMIVLHPTHGRHHADLAEILTTVGMVEAARREARKAIELDHDDAELHVTLGWVLAHDDFGQLYGFDHDHAGARAELERAVKLAPKDDGAAGELGRLLERDSHGRAYEAGADLPGAVRAWRAAYEIEPSATNGDGVMRTLMWTGDFAGAEKFARTMKPSTTRDALIVASIAVASGVPAALREASSLGSQDARAKAIASAGSILMMMRHYDQMRALFAEVNAFSASSAQGQLSAAIARRDQPLDRKTPDGAAIEAELEAMGGGPSKAFWDATTQDEVASVARKSLGAAMQKVTLPSAVIADITRSSIKAHADGDAAMWRIDYDAFGSHSFAYVVMDRGTIKEVGDSLAPEGVARHILRLLAKNDLATAVRALDWLVKDVANEPMFHLVWGPNHATDRETAELAAAILAGDTDPRALPIVKACAHAAPGVDLACMAAVLSIDAKHEAWADLDTYATAKLAIKPTEAIPVVTKAEAAMHLGAAKDAIALLDDQLKRTPDLAPVVQARIQAAFANNDVQDAIQRLEAHAKLQANGNAHNELAWDELGANVNLPAALESAREAVRLSPESTGSFHTLAAIEAELDDVKKAHDDDLTAIRLRGRDRPTEVDWYVTGRIAEQLGFRDDAIAAYRHLKRHAHGSPFDTFDLAQRRLAVLGKP